MSVPQVLHGHQHFFEGLAQPEHHAGLGSYGGLGASLHLAKHGKGAVVGGPMADRRGEATDGFQVVVEDVGLGGKDDFQGEIPVQEVRDQDLDGDSRVELADLLDGLAEVFGSAVLEIVAGHGGDDDVLEPHPAGGLCDARGFVGVQGQGLESRHGAEAAGAGATVAGDHEGRGAPAPTFPMVRAFGAFADGVELQFVQQRARMGEGVRSGEREAQPFGEAGTGFQTDRGRRRHAAENV